MARDPCGPRSLSGFQRSFSSTAATLISRQTYSSARGGAPVVVALGASSSPANRDRLRTFATAPVTDKLPHRRLGVAVDAEVSPFDFQSGRVGDSRAG